MFLRRKQVNAPTYAFCESGNAVAMGVIHLRVVPDARSRGRGFPLGTEALCGKNLDFGWDVPGEVTADEVRKQSTPPPGDGVIWLCKRCAAQFFHD